jgi:prophage regulatory protein
MLRLPEVIARTGKARTSIYEGVERGDFPAPVALGPRSVGWVEDEIDSWLDHRIAERDAREVVKSPEYANGTGR